MPWQTIALALSITGLAACSQPPAAASVPQAQNTTSAATGSSTFTPSAAPMAMDQPSVTLPAVTPSAADATAAPATTPTVDRWPEVLLRMPFPYNAPLPPAEPSAIDGVYAKFEAREDTPVPCRRCPDYAPDRGVWRMQLDKGVFRIQYEFRNWTSIGSFTTAGNQITFFNDPNCIEDVGTYTYTLDSGQLTLKEIKDDCAIRLRVKNFTMRPWLSCQPPNREAALTDHWKKPEGCR